MGTGHRHPVTLPGPSALHGRSPQVKVAATVLFVVAVAATPRRAVWAYLLHAALLLGVARAGRVPLGLLARRIAFEVPFVAFALLLPFVAEGDRVEVLGVHLSEPGLWAAGSVVAKATLGLAATTLLVATTHPVEVLRGLERLRVPGFVVAVTAFLLRYVEVVGDELRRLEIARISRGQDPRRRARLRAVAASAGALFVRTYERGERVHLAMRSRGYDGSGPLLHGRAAPARAWLQGLSVPALAGLVCAAAWVAA